MKKPLWYGRAALLATALSLSLTLAACGGGDDAGTAAPTGSAMQPQAHSDKPTPNLHCAP